MLISKPDHKDRNPMAIKSMMFEDYNYNTINNDVLKDVYGDKWVEI
jgi:hypothetical protein